MKKQKKILIISLAFISMLCGTTLRAQREDNSFIEHTVIHGDNLYKIAKKYIDRSPTLFIDEFVEQIKSVNDISDSNIIHIDQVLLIPTGWIDLIASEVINHDSLCGIYLNTYSLTENNVQRIISKYDSLGCNALVVDFSNVRGTLFYSSMNSIARENDLNIPIISHPRKLANLLHKYGIEFIARVTMFKDTTLAHNYPDWRPVLIPDSTDTLASEKKLKEHWLNPNNQEVQKYKLDIIKEIISLGVDEIQLDYVRFPTEGHLLNADFGIPDSMTKQDVITDFISKVFEVTQQEGVTLSADIFGIVALQHPDDVRNTGQDIRRIMPFLDRIHPMIYPSHFYGEFWGKAHPGKEPYYFIYRICSVLREEIEDDNKIIPYLESFSLYNNSVDPFTISAQIQAVKDAGLEGGFLFWNAGANYEATWEALEEFKE
ncbi:MAG: LysM peptidoglycan-binding domain-containing protein [Candidatus Cloacimonetes bacterium]|nr:LysM peptidoglycan-binding domain-containing protein [Candidatus Cloacimonadota bacterium]